MTFNDDIEHLQTINDLKEQSKQLCRIFEKYFLPMTEHHDEEKHRKFNQQFDRIVKDISTKYNIDFCPCGCGTIVGNLAQLLEFFNPIKYSIQERKEIDEKITMSILSLDNASIDQCNRETYFDYDF